MRRILLSISLLFISGIVIAGFAPSSPLPILILSTSLLLAVIIGSLIFFHGRKRPLPVLLLSLFFIAAGFLYTQSYASFHPNLLQPYYDQQVSIKGVVADDPIFLNEKWQYLIRTEQIGLAEGQEVQVKDRIQISDSRKNGPFPKYGDRVNLYGTLRPLSPQRNPGGYDDQSVLERQGVHARLSVYKPDGIQIIGTEKTWYGATIAPLRDHVWKVLKRMFPPGEAELVGGLVIGFQTDLPEEWENAFQMLSITHILAASGMNVGLIAGACFWLFRWFRISKSIANPIVISIIILYVLLAGAGPSVVRAGLMAILVVVGLSLGRKTDLLTTIAFAAFVSVVWNPGVLSNLGFILSFVTTLGLLLLTPRLIPFFPGPMWLRTALAGTLAAQIASTPILIYYFNQVSPFSILANLYILPLTCLLVPMGFALLVLGCVHPWLTFPFVGAYRILLKILVEPVVWFSQATSEWMLTIPSPPLWMVWLFYGSLLIFLQRKYLQNDFINKIWLIRGMAALTIVLAVIWVWPSSEMRVTFLDVGQGDCALIETPTGKKILVDGGGTPSFLQSNFDPGEKVVLPFLRHKGVRTIDFMIATHGDEDHILGLITVVNKLKVNHLIVSGYDDPSPAFQQLVKLAREKGIAIYEAKSGIGWELEKGVHWQFFHPVQIRTGTRSDTNANSIVFEMTYGSRRFLFTGDVEGEVEPDFLPYVRKVDVLKVAHHGSEYSTSELFLQEVQPEHAVISAGKNNQYHHPHSEVLQRLAAVGAQIFRTDKQGAITVTTDGNNLQVDSMY